MASTFDIWFVAANQVYKAVPYGVATGWAEQGRLGADDKIRPAGVDTAWVRAANHPLIGDFLFVGGPPAVNSGSVTPLEPIELDAGWGRPKADEDDDVDMIPLIDISLVLLIYFMMTSVISTVSPIEVPEMKHAAQLGKEAGALTVDIDQLGPGEVVYGIRIGNAPAAPEDNNLPSVGALLTRLDARLGDYGEPPEVRIACHKELPSSRVRDVAAELDRRKTAGRIAFYGAEVNEVSP